MSVERGGPPPEALGLVDEDGAVPQVPPLSHGSSAQGQLTGTIALEMSVMAVGLIWRIVRMIACE